LIAFSTKAIIDLKFDQPGAFAPPADLRSGRGFIRNGGNMRVVAD
jgi:hypothetical protein